MSLLNRTGKGTRIVNSTSSKCLASIHRKGLFTHERQIDWRHVFNGKFPIVSKRHHWLSQQTSNVFFTISNITMS